MQIRTKKSLFEYKYLVMFDLASHLTGVCLWNIKENTPQETQVIEVSKNTEAPVLNLYKKLEEYFSQLEEKGIKKEEILVYKEAMPVQLRGGSSTVQTFVALARSHGILDLYTSLNNIDVYDYVGVYPISTHSYLKKLMGWDNSHKVEKKDVLEYVINTYKLGKIGFDEADAVFLAKTFIDVKWDKDLDEAIKEIKKHAKGLKTERGVNSCLEEKVRLESLRLSPKN